MTTQEIRQYFDAVIASAYVGVTAESGEVMTSEGGDGRFFGKVFATRYTGAAKDLDVFLAIGESERKVQIVRLGKAECLNPSEADLDVMLEKELGLKREEES